jgi:cell division initiation protein
VFLSPAEIKQQQLREKRGAYERVDVDTLLDNVIGSYQHVWLERDGLKARVEELEKEIANTKELEKLLRDGLAAAQRAAEQVKEEAQQQVSGLVDEAQAKADKLLAEARAKADEIVVESRERRDRLQSETSRLEQANRDVRERYKAFLLEALSLVEATAEHEAVAPAAAPTAAEETAPVRELEEEPVGWLATVPLVAATSSEVAESVAEQEREPEPEPEPEPVVEVAEVEEVEEDEEIAAAATVLLRTVQPLEEEPVAAPEPQSAESEPEPEPAAEEPAAEADEESLAPDEAYMTFRSVPAVQPSAPASAREEPADEEDEYEDWQPRSN